MPTQPLCATHTAFIYDRGGTVITGQLDDLVAVQWQRARDEISGASVRIGPQKCCTLMQNVKPVSHELHIFRDGVLVWAGVITRIEFEWDGIDVVAEDMLWVAKRRAVEVGYNWNWPPSGTGPTSAIEVVDDLLRDKCYALNGDEWNMVANLNPITGPDDPNTARAALDWSASVWEEVDGLAQYSGVDYTVVGRNIYWFDVNYDWNPLPTLDEQDISEFPRIVEYGNTMATRFIKTDGQGYAGVATDGAAAIEFGTHIDLIQTDADQELREGPPDAAELADWNDSAARQLARRNAPRQSIVIPANTTLMPSSTWDVDTLMPGSWCTVTVDRVCRTFNGFQRLNEVRVRENGIVGEVINITMIDPPSTRVTPP